MIKTASHNVRNMTIASVGQKICAFVYFTILARYLGPEDVGKYVFTLSFAAIFVILIDLGLTSVLIREGARHKERLQKYNIPVLEYPNRMSTRVDWDMSRRVLTDQYSPANLLRDN